MKKKKNTSEKKWLKENEIYKNAAAFLLLFPFQVLSYFKFIVNIAR